VGTFAGFAAVALENAKLLEESIVKERLEKELDVAREVQYKILPQRNPDFKKFEIASLFVPAFEVGGDYYDFFNISKTKLGIVIADVSGKGIEAAFIMAQIKGIFSTLAKLYSEPKELLIKANSILEDSIARKSFVTAIYGVIDTEKDTFKFARAGHSPLLYFDGSKINRIIPSGIGLGLDYSGKFENTLKEMEIKLNNNDIITLFTDGINESLNEKYEEFGFERLEEIIVNNSNFGVEELSNNIMKSVSTFSQNNSQHDDITLVLFKWDSHINLKGDS
jgi:serine phosphatase RsbU (regulator of sigma subunit)